MNAYLDVIRERMNRQPVQTTPIPPLSREVIEIAGVEVSSSQPRHLSESEAEVESSQMPTVPEELLSPSNLKALTKMFEAQDRDQAQELEFSIGSFEGDKFYPGFQSFIPVARLMAEYTASNRGPPEVIRDTVMVAGNIRRVTSEAGGVHYEKKERSKDRVDDHEWGYRIVMSREELTDANDEEFERTATVLRVRNRSSFEFDNVRLDITIVNQTPIKDGELGRSLIKYEIELERIGNIGVKDFVKHMRDIYTTLGNGSPISWQQRLFITKQHNALLQFSPKGVTKMAGRYWNKPENISIDADILDDVKFNPAVTTKLDGERRMLLILSNVTCLLWSPDEIAIIGPGNESLNRTMIDVEFMANDASIHAFDLLFLRGEDVRRKPLRTRINLLLTLLDKTTKLFNVKSGSTGVSFMDPALPPTFQPLPPLAPIPGSVRIGMSDEKRRALGLPVRARPELNVVSTKTELVFSINSDNSAPGQGVGEVLDESDLSELSGLSQMDMWRRKLSNLFECAFLYDGKEFTSAEHALQYAKFRELGRDKIALQFVQSEWSPADAIIYGGDRNETLAKKNKPTGLVKLSDEENLKWIALREGRLADVARAKFTQCLPAQRVLLATGNAQLFCADGEQERWEFLERLRAQLRSDSMRPSGKPSTVKAQSAESALELSNLQFRVKQFYFPAEVGDRVFNDLYERAEECLAVPVLGQDGGPLPTDGIIFQGLEGYTDKARKWKPASKLTIDFRVKKTELGNQLFVGNKNGETLFLGSRRNPIDETMVVSDELTNGVIYEMKWEDGFVVDRERPDKTEPNYIVTATSVWDDINDPISEKDITGHGLRVMRRYINRAKENLLKQELGANSTLLDWGTGRGGMFGIWNRVGIKKVFGVEPDEANRQEQLRRMKGMKLKTQLIQVPSGAEDIDAITAKTANTRIDAITTFFSLTFFAQSKAKYDAMLKTIGTVRPNKVIGMVLDGDRVKNDLLKSLIGADEDDAGQITTKAFTITQTSKFTNNAFDNEIETTIEDESSMVKSVQEWLFFFQYFVDEMRSLGYKLATNRFLEEKAAAKPTMFSRLSDEARKFSSYNRAFSFVRTGVARTNIGRMMVLQDKDEQPLPGRFQNFVYQGVPRENSLANAILRGVGEEVGEFVEWASIHTTVKDISDDRHINVIVLMADEQRVDKQQRIVGVFPSVESRTDLVNSPVVIVYTPDDIHYHHVFFKAPKETLKQLHTSAEKRKIANHEKMSLRELRLALRMSDSRDGKDEHSFDLDDEVIKEMLSIKPVERSDEDVEESAQEEVAVADKGDDDESKDEEVDYFSLNETQQEAYEKMYEVIGNDRDGVTVETIVKRLDKYKVGRKLDIAERIQVAKVLLTKFAEELPENEEDAEVEDLPENEEDEEVAVE